MKFDILELAKKKTKINKKKQKLVCNVGRISTIHQLFHRTIYQLYIRSKTYQKKAYSFRNLIGERN